MTKRFPTHRGLVIFCLVSVLILATYARPYHKERKTVNKIVAIYNDIKHHMKEGRIEWNHLGDELKGIAKPVLALGHHDKVDLFKPLQKAVRGKDKKGLEKAFQRIFVYLVRENLHRSEDSAGKVEKTIQGFVKNARMAYRPLASSNGKMNGQVEGIFKEMEATAGEVRALKAKLEAQKEELEKIVNGIHN